MTAREQRDDLIDARRHLGRARLAICRAQREGEPNDPIHYDLLAIEGGIRLATQATVALTRMRHYWKAQGLDPLDIEDTL